MRNPQIWVPGMNKKPKIAECGCCGKEFYEGEYQTAMRHMKHCSDENLPHLLAEMPQNRAPGIFGRESGDLELEEFISRHRESVLKGKRIRL